MAYLAGFFDGEGCIHLAERVAYTRYLTKSRGQTRYSYSGFVAIIKISQNVRRPLEIFQELFGGKVRVRGHMGEGGRTCRHFEWECPRTQMIAMLESLIPYLIVKKDEAEVAIRFCQTFQRGKKLTEEQRNERRAMIAQVKAAKRIGRVFLIRGAA